MRLMEDHTLRQPVMVSRLPKFGSRPPGGANLPVANGSAIPSGSAAGTKALGAPRQNGIVRPPPTLSFKWKERVEPEESKGGAYRPQQQQQRVPVTAREIKRPSAPMATTVRRSASSVSSTSQRTAHHPAPTRLAANHGFSNGLLPGPGHGGLSQSSDSLRLMPQDNMVRSQSFSHMTRVPASGGASIARSFSFNQELPRPSTRHTLPTRPPHTLPTLAFNGARGGKMTGIARVQSAGTSLLAPTNLKKPLLPAPASSKPSALSYRLMRPSLIRQPRPTPIGRAQEEPAKDLGQKGQKEGSEGASVRDDPLVDPHLSSPTKSAGSPTATPQGLTKLPTQARADEPRADDVLADTVTHDKARAEDSRVQDQTEHPESPLSETRLDDLRVVDVREEDSTPAELTEVSPELDKPEEEDPRAVDICAESKTRAIDPSPAESNHETSATAREDLHETSPDKDGDAGPERVEGLPSLCVTSVTGETLEDMSLSSTSSLERSNEDTSEEYMDDFDNLGNGCGVLLLPPVHDEGLIQSEPLSEDTTQASRQQDVCSMTSLHSFLSESVDWGEMGLTGGKEAFSAPGGGVSSDGVFRDGSSLDLSPSDSSGATYMWDDEDGLEPLGGAIIPCHSYDSDLNSMDILNNLDNLDSCDLEEDDLMLDVDLPEDASLHSEADGRSHWRKMQLWGRQDHLYNNNNSGDDPLKPLDGDQVDHVCLDELTLQHMAQDCTSVKNQLLQLKQLLQVEETDCSDEGVSSSDNFTPDISEDRSCDEQVQELLMEVQKLREELRNKDKMIAQLTQQMSVPEEPNRCSCHLKKPEGQKGTRPLHQDGTTQTPWRGHAPQILPASGAMPCVHPHQSALVAPSHTFTHTHSFPREGNSAATATASVRPHKPQSCPPSCPDPPPAFELSVPQPHHHHQPNGRRGKSRLAPHPRMERLHRGPLNQAEPLAPDRDKDRDRDVTHTHNVFPNARPGSAAAAHNATADRRGQQLRQPQQPQQPPPARGLPSFSTSPQASMPLPLPAPRASMPIPVPSASTGAAPGTGRSALVPPRGYRQNPPSPSHSPSCPTRDLENGSSHTHTQTHTRTLVPPNNSHLPKPKRH